MVLLDLNVELEDVLKREKEGVDWLTRHVSSRPRKSKLLTLANDFQLALAPPTVVEKEEVVALEEESNEPDVRARDLLRAEEEEEVELPTIDKNESYVPDACGCTGGAADSASSVGRGAPQIIFF